ncbi:MAG: DUF4282 domain-containing protein [Caulobacteraceae bacterium]
MSLYATSGRRKRGAVFDLLSLDRLLTGPVIHLIYWGGLALILLFGFGAVGASAGLALRALSLEGLLLAIPAVVAGLLIMAVLALLWRGACEFFVAVFSIAENLNAMRAQQEREGGVAPSASPKFGE